MSGSSVTRTNPPGVGWTEIRDAAVAAAGRGWPVVPGTFRSGDGGWYGRGGATELLPINAARWETAGITDPEQAMDLWTHRPYGVLLVCGHGVDALELPSEVAELLPALAGRGLAAPLAAVFPPPRWLLFVATGSGHSLLPKLAMAGVVLRTRGDWVALPPTNLGYARARWRAEPPAEQGLPDCAEVQQVLADVLDSELPQ